MRVLEGGKTNEMKQHPGYLMYVLVMQDKILDASVCVICRASMDVYCVIPVEGFKENMFSDVTLPIGELHHQPPTTTTDITTIVITIVTTNASS